MGGKESKPIDLSYEEALKRVNESELNRIKDAYKRSATLNGALTKQAFAREVLGDAVTNQLAESFFYACGGTAKGIIFKDLFCSLVLLTRGRKEEKIRFIFSVYANEAGTHVLRSEMLNQLKATEEKFTSEAVWKLFVCNDRASYDEFKDWLVSHPDATTITRWLLDENSTVSLSNDLETPTFYQTLAGVTHLEETEILELEKRYWILKGSSPSGKLDTDTLVPMISPPLPYSLAKGVFNAFDANRDNHIDFKEMACGISAACRGPQIERQKFCFKVFDRDRDGKLNKDELLHMVESLILLRAEDTGGNKDKISSEKLSGQVQVVISNLLRNHDPYKTGCITQEEFLIWTLNDDLTSVFLDIIFQVCHIILGLKPSSPIEEGEIVLGWLQRTEKKSLTIGTFWYIINIDWWNIWLQYVTFASSGTDALALCNSPNSNSNSASRKTKFQKANIEGCLAMDNTGVTVTSIASLPSKEDAPTIYVNDFKDFQEGRSTNLQRQSSSASLSKRNFNSSSNNLTVHFDSSRSSSPRHSPGLPRRLVNFTPLSYQSGPSAIDNCSLIETSASRITQLTNEGGRLKRIPPLVQGRDFVLVPEPLWKVLQQWYGGSPALPRQVINSAGGGIEIELYPITLKILRHVQPTNRINQSYGNNNWVGFGSYGAAISKLADSTQYYVSTFPSTSLFPKRTLASIVAFSRLATLRQLYDLLSLKLKLRLEDMRLWHVRDEPAGMTLLEDELLTLEDSGLTDLSQVLLEVRNKDLTWPEEMSQISRSSNYLVKSLNKHMPAEKGATGLNNLGNTCFFNAALQCCSNTIPLTTYFTRNMHLYELNPDNPCGMKGYMARQYGSLIQEIWNGDAKTVAPLKLRWTIGKYSGNFTTFQQHDSQELLAFLLDGLHEDLNRVQNKPYTELKDSEGRPDTIVAQEAWENHILRNKSVIVDLFHGQLKSKVTCGVCGNESARFDPFSYLTLQLPMESYVYTEVVVLKLDGSMPIKYGLRLISDSKYQDVKGCLSMLTGIAQHQFILTELQNSQIKTVLPDETRIRSSVSLIFAYELPTPASSTSMEENSVSGDGNDRQLFKLIQISTHHSSPCLKSSSDPVEQKKKIVDQRKTTTLMENFQSDEPDESSSVEVESLASSLSRGSSRSLTHKKASSLSSSTIRDEQDLESAEKGFIIALHRKMIRQEVYFLSSQKTKPSLFGLPLIVPCGCSITHKELYRNVWMQVSRLVSPLPPSETPGPNHAHDCDDSLGYEFPFVLRTVEKSGQYCAKCPWFNFCRGCEIPCDGKAFNVVTAYLAVDWDPTALHLRYQSSLERVFLEHNSVIEMKRKHTEPISLSGCLEAFCSEETLEYSCDKCQKMQHAAKKLQIWRLPPILIVHLKRFQFCGNKWIKSQKIVDFPLRNFDPTNYLASVPRQTILLHRAELEGVDAATYIAGLPEKDIVFLEIVQENQVMENVHVDSSFSSNRSGKSSHSLSNGVIPTSESPATEPTTLDRKRRVRNGSVLYGDALQDFHQHRLQEGFDPLDLKYSLYAIACHTGILEGGHYVCYAKNPQGKWICFNDSSCKEVSESQLDLESAYLLFYQRDGLSVEQYMPNIENKVPYPQEEDDDPEEMRKQCTIM